MLLPHIPLRKRRLERSWRDYPVYDPPHRREERLLTTDESFENFDYFMRVRRERRSHFRDWLLQHFGVSVTADEKGMLQLNRWGNKYAGLLLPRGPTGHPTYSYFTYSPSWTGESTGNNILFDTGIVLGETIISVCPNVRWDMDPISAILPRTAKDMKKTEYSSFHRPTLAGFNNPAYTPMPLHDVYIFASLMASNLPTFEGFIKRFDQPRGLRNFTRDNLLNNFKIIVANYPAGDPYRLREEIGTNDYLKLADEDSEEAGDGE
jgi:hypothetical protein